SESRRITVEREDLDYRNVPGCGDMYRPFKSIMRLGGMMTSEQQAELAEASVQLEQLEAQMASMPASQRQMMESMLGPQLEMIKNMASGGGIEVVSTIAELRCNTGLPDPIEIANTMFGGAFMGGNVGAVETTTGGGAINTEEDLLKMIQIDLERLGYGPGNTDGVLDKATVVAITKFQASKGMEVTGQPSSQLAGILQAIVAN
ncbi:MAG: peptidoglycan-binding protein, partial [Planctomycetaceae bacterium]|nr:peptidoglycan-binding protein [Planctomycetaceae bacterium]